MATGGIPPCFLCRKAGKVEPTLVRKKPSTQDNNICTIDTLEMILYNLMGKGPTLWGAKTESSRRAAEEAMDRILKSQNCTVLVAEEDQVIQLAFCLSCWGLFKSLDLAQDDLAPMMQEWKVRWTKAALRFYEEEPQERGKSSSSTTTASSSQGKAPADDDEISEMPPPSPDHDDDTPMPTITSAPTVEEEPLD